MGGCQLFVRGTKAAYGCGIRVHKGVPKEALKIPRSICYGCRRKAALERGMLQSQVRIRFREPLGGGGPRCLREARPTSLISRFVVEAMLGPVICCRRYSHV